MALFKKKETTPAKKPERSLHDIVQERILTAEGWRRRLIPKARAAAAAASAKKK